MSVSSGGEGVMFFKVTINRIMSKEYRLAIISTVIGSVLMFFFTFLKVADTRYIIFGILLYWIAFFRFIITDKDFCEEEVQCINQNNLVEYWISRNIITLVAVVTTFFLTSLVFYAVYKDALSILTLSVVKTLCMLMAFDNIYVLFFHPLRESYTREYWRQDVTRDVHIGWQNLLDMLPSMAVASLLFTAVMNGVLSIRMGTAVYIWICTLAGCLIVLKSNYHHFKEGFYETKSK